MLPSKSCKTVNANFLLQNFGLTFFDRFKTGTYLVNWFGRGSADRTLLNLQVRPIPMPIHRSFTRMHETRFKESYNLFYTIWQLIAGIREHAHVHLRIDIRNIFDFFRFRFKFFGPFLIPVFFGFHNWHFGKSATSCQQNMNCSNTEFFLPRIFSFKIIKSLITNITGDVFKVSTVIH